MIDDTKKKEIVLSAVNPTAKDSFTILTVDGRDTIASQIEDDIDEYCQKQFDDGPRSHLGASEIGDECERFIWFKFRWMHFEKFNGRMLRLFNRGHLEEERVISWLRGIGFDIKQVEVDGKQTRIMAVNGHFGGSSDSTAVLPDRYCDETQPYTHNLLLEFKTANDKSFGTIKGSGFRKAKPRYWSQACTYGAKLGLKYCLFICVNKNTDDIDVELVELDIDLGHAEVVKAEKIIFSIIPPPRLSDDASFWKCKFCAMNGICHLDEPLEVNCRSCQFATPVENGEWKCNQYQNIIPKDFLAKGCQLWQALPR